MSTVQQDLGSKLYSYRADLLETIELEVSHNLINRIVIAVKTILNCKGNIYTCGNGGSMATAQHLATDLMKNTGGKLKWVHCLGSNPSLLMAHSNDESYDNALAREIERTLDSNDIIIAISTSGNSANVLNVATYAQTVGAVVISLTGFDGGELREWSTIDLHVDSNDIEIVEDVHLSLCHMITRAIRTS